MLELGVLFLVVVGIARIVNAIGDFVGPRVSRARWVILDTIHLSRISPVPCSHCLGYGEIETFDGMARCPAYNENDRVFAPHELYGRPYEPECAVVRNPGGR